MNLIKIAKTLAVGFASSNQVTGSTKNDIEEVSLSGAPSVETRSPILSSENDIPPQMRPMPGTLASLNVLDSKLEKSLPPTNSATSSENLYSLKDINVRDVAPNIATNDHILDMYKGVDSGVPTVETRSPTHSSENDIPPQMRPMPGTPESLNVLDSKLEKSPPPSQAPATKITQQSAEKIGQKEYEGNSL